MHRRFGVIAALATGAIAIVAALPVVSAFRHHTSDSSLIAAEAQAASNTASPPSTAETVRQTGPLPSLAPLVKQLRPVVVNINSRFKPQRRIAQRMPRNRPRFQQPPDGDDENNDACGFEHRENPGSPAELLAPIVDRRVRCQIRL